MSDVELLLLKIELAVSISMCHQRKVSRPHTQFRATISRALLQFVRHDYFGVHVNVLCLPRVMYTKPPAQHEWNTHLCR